MPRSKALDVGPLFELFAAEIGRHLSREMRGRWEQLEQRISRIEQLASKHKGLEPSNSQVAICAVDACQRIVRAKGLCGAHYQQLRYRLSREALGKGVRSRKDEHIPHAEKPKQRKNQAVHLVIRRKGQEHTEQELAQAAEPHAIAAQSTVRDNTERQQIHPGLRPIV